jgi:hypothetical protein
MYEYDEYVYIGISPNDEYKFLYWKDINGNVISNIPNYNFRMPNKNTKYIAYFEKYDRILNLESNIYSDSNING